MRHAAALAADTPSFLAILNHEKTAIVQTENGCYNKITYNQSASHPTSLPATDTGRSRVNDSGPYADIQWLSPLNSPASNFPIETYGATASPIDMQINDILMYCAILVNNNSNIDRFTTSGAARAGEDRGSIVDDGTYNYPVTGYVNNFPDDRPPNDDGSNTDAASFFGSYYAIGAPSVVSGGGHIAVRSGSSSYINVDRNTSNPTRYVENDHIPTYTYTPPTATYQKTVSVTLKFPLTGYSKVGVTAHRTDECIGNGSTPAGRASIGNNNGQPIFWNGTDYTENRTDPTGNGGTEYKYTSNDPHNPYSFAQWKTMCAPRSPLLLSFTIYVLPKVTVEPINTTEGYCSGVTGTADDADSPGHTLGVKLFKGSALVASTNTSGGEPNTYSFPASLVSSATTSASYTVQVQGVGTNGAADGPGDIVTTPPFSIGPCGDSPFFSIASGDIAAGAGFENSMGSCTQSSSANIDAENSGDPTYSGSGTQSAAFADGTINGFATGQTAYSGGLTYSGKPSELAFANGTAPPGGFGTLPCQTDYASAISSTTAFSNDFTQSGVYHDNGNTIIDTGSGVELPKGVVIKLLVTGDVYITGAGITYDDSGGPGDYPRFELISTGGIYLDPGVSNLHGLYVAQGSTGTSGGDFVTCAYNSGGTYKAYKTTDADFYSSCSATNLSVYGSVAANTLSLNRLKGSYLTAGSQPAETFSYSPEFWLATPDCSAANPNPSAPDANCSASASGGSFNPNWDEVSNLPPVL